MGREKANVKRRLTDWLFEYHSLWQFLFHFDFLEQRFATSDVFLKVSDMYPLKFQISLRTLIWKKINNQQHFRRNCLTCQCFDCESCWRMFLHFWVVGDFFHWAVECCNGKRLDWHINSLGKGHCGKYLAQSDVYELTLKAGVVFLKVSIIYPLMGLNEYQDLWSQPRSQNVFRNSASLGCEF